MACRGSHLLPPDRCRWLDLPRLSEWGGRLSLSRGFWSGDHPFRAYVEPELDLIVHSGDDCGALGPGIPEEAPSWGRAPSASDRLPDGHGSPYGLRGVAVGRHTRTAVAEGHRSGPARPDGRKRPGGRSLCRSVRNGGGPPCPRPQELDT